jgi:hypothetical protein
MYNTSMSHFPAKKAADSWSLACHNNSDLMYVINVYKTEKQYSSKLSCYRRFVYIDMYKLTCCRNALE